ncbi:MAG: sugar phosphate isomerase/epimerase [candidate division WOR-3 bacterium]
MKIFISQIFFKENDFDFDFISKYFDGIELRGDRLIKDYDIFNFDLFKNKKFNLLIHSTFENIDISSLNEWERVKSIREVEKSIPIAKKLNIKYAIVHPSSKVKDENARMENLKKSLESLIEIKETGKIFGVEVLVENLPLGYLCSYEKEISFFIDNGFDLCFDFGHSMLTFKEPFEIVEKLKEHIKVLHLHSNDRNADQHNFLKQDFEIYKNILNIVSKDTTVVIETKDDKKNIVLEFLSEYSNKK